MNRTLLILPAICAIAISGCAQGGDTAKDSTANYKGAEKLVAGTIEDLQAYGEKGESEKICAQLLTVKLSQKIGEQGCAGAVKDAMEQTDKADLEVTAVKIDPKDAAKAMATVKAKTGKDSSQSSTIELAKESGRWKISSFG